MNSSNKNEYSNKEKAFDKAFGYLFPILIEGSALSFIVFFYILVRK